MLKLLQHASHRCGSTLLQTTSQFGTTLLCKSPPPSFTATQDSSNLTPEAAPQADTSTHLRGDVAYVGVLPRHPANTGTMGPEQTPALLSQQDTAALAATWPHTEAAGTWRGDLLSNLDLPDGVLL
jgi:hypothetical protein